MSNKPFKHITHLLYCFLLSLPVISILGRVIYTQSNPNAIDSYSDNVSIESNYITDNEFVNAGTLITVTFNNNPIIDTSRYYVLNEESNINSLYFPSSTWSIHSFSLIVSSGRSRLHVWDTNNNTYDVFNWENVSRTFYFVTSNNIQISNISTYYYDLSFNTYVKGSLDNVFDYSVSKFIQNNNLGNIDLFSWFGDIFLDTDNQTNKLYLDFINWYLNYTLLVSSSYLIFMVLYWFTAYVRKIMDKSMNQDFGGF